jgi:hypothetical protein
MNVEAICPPANQHCFNLGKLIRIDLIKALRSDGDDFDCFASAHNSVCDQSNCFWRQSCLAAARQH